MRVKECMTQRIATVDASDPIKIAADEMAAHDVGALPVMRNGKVVGVITDRDITCRAVAANRDPNNTPCGDIMTEGIVVIDEDDDVREAARTMESRQIRRIFATDREGRITGVLSQADMALQCANDELTGELVREISRPTHAPAHV